MLASLWIPHTLLASVLPHEIHSLAGIQSSVWWPLIDTICLVALSSPLVYYWAIAPYVQARDNADLNLRQYKRTLDFSPDQIYINNLDTLEFIYMNRAAQDRFGWTEDEYLGKTLHDISDKFDEARFRKSTRPLVFGTKDMLTFETLGIQQEPIEITHQLIDVEGGSPWFVSIVRDMTKQKKSEKAKSEFIATISHELRTPLTSIKGALGLMVGGVGKDDPVKLAQLMNMASKNSDRLEKLVNDLLDVEKLNAGMFTFEMRLVDLSKVVIEAAAANEGYAAQHEVFFKTDGTNLPVWVVGDRQRLIQVLSNLMSNAAKFSNKGNPIDIVLTLHGSNVRVSVRDTGCGIPEASREAVFERFTQVDSSDQRSKGGAGLGLNISKAIVEKHHGTIDFTSEVGKGTTFFFDLPIKLALDKRPPDDALFDTEPTNKTA